MLILPPSFAAGRAAKENPFVTSAGRGCVDVIEMNLKQLLLAEERKAGEKAAAYKLSLEEGG